MQTIKEIFSIKEPKPFVSKLTAAECSAPDQMVGVEIETENCRQVQDWYLAELSKIWAVEVDGSLRGRAYEFISKPAAIKILIPELATFYAKTGFTDANYTDRCSIHVHTNVLDMTQQQLGTLCLVYSIVEEVLFQFVNFYKMPTQGAYRDTNIYCVPWNQCRMNHDIVRKLFENPESCFRHWQKYTALNLIPVRSQGTVEWRHMHGSADLEKITKWLNLIGSVMNYSKKNEFENVIKTVKELNDTSAYRQFFSDVLGDYLPYDPLYENALSAGVVHAKYALIGLKDTKPKPIDRPKKATAVMFDDMVAEAAANINPADFRDWQGIRRDNAAPVPEQQPEQILRGWAPAAEAPVNPVPRAGGGAAPRARFRPAPIRDAEIIPVYPLERVTMRRPGEVVGLPPAEWGVRDAVGRLWTSEGGRVAEGFEINIPTGRYARGFGNLFWENVGAAYRPNVQVQGGF